MMLSSMFRRVSVICQEMKMGHRCFRAKKFFCSGGGASELVDLGAPCMMKPPSFGRDGMVYHLYSPVKKEVVSFKNRGGKEEADLMGSEFTFWVGTSHGWLAVFNSGKMCLLNPFSGRRIDLPPFPSTGERAFPYKVILSHQPEQRDCRAVMILGSMDRAAYCRPGRGSSWVPLGRWDDRLRKLNEVQYGDFAYSAGRRSFVGSTRARVDPQQSLDERLELWGHPKMELDLSPAAAPPRVNPYADPGVEWKTHIVPAYYSSSSAAAGDSDNDNDNDNADEPEPSRSELYLVRRFATGSAEAMDYIVYRIDDDGSYKLCSSLDDLVMFVGVNHSFAVEATRFPQLKPNSIYFSGIWYLLEQANDVFNYVTKEYTIFPDEFPDYHSTLPWIIPSSL